MPLIKTQITDNFVLDFLRKKYPTSEIVLQRIKGGELSQAFRFSINNVSKILRFNVTSSECFQKDKVCYDKFSKYGIPIPEIYEVGEIDGYYYAISELAPGKTLDNLGREDNLLITPKLFDELIRISRISLMGEGYGDWNPKDLKAKYSSGKNWALAKLTPEHWPEIHRTEDYFDLKLMGSIAQEVKSLVKYIPEQRYMVHGDLGFSNTLSDGREITGVIDWAECMYGDFVYDLCWLQFWSDKVDYLGMFPKYSGGLPLENYRERGRLYLILIALESMVIFAESNRKDDYLDCIRILKKLDTTLY